MFQITWSLTAGCVLEALIFYRLVSFNSKEFWIRDGYTVFYSDSLVQLIGACLNVGLLWLESSQNKTMRLVKNVQRYKALLISSIVSLYAFFLILNFIFLEYWVWQGILMSYCVGVIVTFGVGACRISRLLSLGISFAPSASDEHGTRRFQSQRNEIGKIIKTAKIVCSITGFGLGSELGTLVSYQKQAGFAKFLLSAALRMSMLCIKVMVIQYVRGDTPFLGLKFCKGKQVLVVSQRRRLQRVISIRIAPAPHLHNNSSNKHSHSSNKQSSNKHSHSSNKQNAAASSCRSFV